MMQGTLDVPIYGRISVLNVFRPKGAKLDLLFLLTERYKFCVLSYNNATGAFGGSERITYFKLFFYNLDTRREMFYFEPAEGAFGGRSLVNEI
jgi:hypothetical protein